MSDLVAFLRARLDEDEAAAKAAPNGLDSQEWSFWVDVDDEADYYATNGYRDRFPPSRMLREVAAKRAIVREYEAARRLMGLTGTEDKAALRYREWTCQHLAAAYSDHPDYPLEREKGGPEGPRSSGRIGT